MAVLFLCMLLAVLEYTNSQCQTIEQCGCPLRFIGGCCLVVEEGQSATTRIGFVDQFDLDSVSNPVYRLQDTYNRTFSIDQSGVLFTQRTLDRESISEELACISLAVAVETFFEPVIVKISDINDNSPTFGQSSYTVEVPETTATDPDYTCTLAVENLLRAEDADEGTNAVVRYSVEGNSNFRIPDDSTPCVTNVRGFALDRENSSANYSFVLVAMNPPPESLASRVTVTYVLLDRNDNPPEFDNQTYVFSVREDEPLMTEIFQFIARDRDLEATRQSGLTYSIRDGEAVFKINETSGVLLLVGAVDADNPNSRRYNLEVIARDGDNQGTANVVINILDANELATLQFQNEIHEITENRLETERGTALVSISILDRDSSPSNKNNSLTVVGGDGAFSLIFNLQPEIYILVQDEVVDFELNRTIELFLRTTERGNPPLTQTVPYSLSVLDVNDNRPSLEVTEFNVTEEEPENQLITDLSRDVFDPDSGANGRIGEYSLVSVRNDTADLTEQFEGTLDSRTGELRTGSARVDRETLGNSLQYTIILTDMGQPALSQTVRFTVRILDRNDNAPVFDRSSYMFSVEEGMPSGTSVGVVQATDRDSPSNAMVFYSIVDQDSQFSIQSRTGEIESRVEFDRETRKTYQISVRARDNGTPQQTSDTVAMVAIEIVDIDDEDPVFPERQYIFTITSSLRPGSAVGTVTATDQDLAPFNRSIYMLESSSSLFSIRNQSSGVITLESHLEDPGMFQLNVSAHNPGREDRKDTVAVIISVTEEIPVLDIPLIAGVAGGVTLLLVLIAVVVIIIACTYYRSKRYNQYNMKEISNNLNNVQQQPPILKLPVASNNQQGRSRVTFKESVEETHYNQQSVVIDTDNTVRKESITKFDSYPRSRLRYSAGDEPHVHPDGPASPNDVVELEMSPRGHVLNGAIPPARHMRGYEHSAHSPMVHVVPGGMRGVVDLSQNTSSDGHTYLDDEESMYSDDASIVNADLSRYGNKSHDMDPRYRAPPTHLELHHHLPTMSHGEPTSSSLAQLHAHNLAQLAEANRQQQYAASMHSNNSSLTLTPLQHASISTQSTHSPISQDHAHSHTATSVSTNSNHIHSSGRNYPHPLIMPEAFPMDTTDIHRFPIGSYAEDYGEASTYASADLDEALGFNNSEAEPGIISLTATDYGDTEL